VAARGPPGLMAQREIAAPPRAPSCRYVALACAPGSASTTRTARPSTFRARPAAGASRSRDPIVVPWPPPRGTKAEGFRKVCRIGHRDTARVAQHAEPVQPSGLELSSCPGKRSSVVSTPGSACRRGLRQASMPRPTPPTQVSTPQRHHPRPARGDGAQSGSVRARCWSRSSVGPASEGLMATAPPREGPTITSGRCRSNPDWAVRMASSHSSARAGLMTSWHASLRKEGFTPPGTGRQPWRKRTFIRVSTGY
jgi:hypothetical protein